MDLADYAGLQFCFSGEGVTPPEACGLPEATYHHDADSDGDVDLADFANFQACFDPSGTQASPECLSVHDFDTGDASDGDIDLDDYARFFACFHGPFVTPDQACGQAGRRGSPPPSGTFALHGRPIDVLSDGHVLIYIRARYYDPKNGRWLQRDPTGYANGDNLYESFGGNAASRRDPAGTDSIYEDEAGDLVYLNGVWLWGVAAGFWPSATTFDCTFATPVPGRPDLVLVDFPVSRFAYVMTRQNAIGFFNPPGSGFRSEEELALHIAKRARGEAGTMADTSRKVLTIIDKLSMDFKTPGEFYDAGHYGFKTEAIQDLEQYALWQTRAELAQAGTLAQMGYIVANTAFMVPAGVGGVAAEMIEVACGAVDEGLTAEGLQAATLGVFFAVVPGGDVAKTKGLFRVGKYGRLPRPRMGRHGHHGMMSRWMGAHFPEYNQYKAPAILMPAESHQATYGVFNIWRNKQRIRMGGKFKWLNVSETEIRALSNKMFRAAKVPPEIQAEYWREYRRMIRGLRQ